MVQKKTKLESKSKLVGVGNKRITRSVTLSKSQQIESCDSAVSKNKQINMATSSNFSVISNFTNTFDGASGECEFFFSQFEAISKLAKITEEEQVTLLKSRLRGRAREFLISDPKLMHELNYEKLKKAFVDYFGEEFDINARQLQFSNIKMNEHESVKNFAHRITMASNNYLGTSSAISEETQAVLDRLKLSKLINCLIPELQTEVLKAKPDTFSEAVKIASNVQSAYETVTKIRINHLLSQENVVTGGHESNESRMEREIQGLKQQLNGLRINREEPMSQRQPINDPPPFCVGCGRNTHFFSECYTFKQIKNAGRGGQRGRGGFRRNNRDDRDINRRNGNREETTPGQNEDTQNFLEATGGPRTQ